MGILTLYLSILYSYFYISFFSVETMLHKIIYWLDEVQILKKFNDSGNVFFFIVMMSQ